MNKETLETLVVLLPIITGLFGWLLKAPWMRKWVPDNVTRAIADLDQETINKWLAIVRDPEVRRAFAITELKRLSYEQASPVHLNDELAGWVVDGLCNAFGHVIEDVKRLKK